MELMEEEQALVQPKGLSRLTSCLRQKKFNPGLFNGSILACTLSLTMNEVVAHMLLRKSAEFAELPAFSNDVLLITVGILETLCAPFFSWLGHTRRATTMGCWVLLTSASAVPLFFLGWEKYDWNAIDLCNAIGAHRSTVPVIYVRLVVVALMALVAAFARLSVLAHGVALLDDFDSKDTVKNFGILIGARVLALNLTSDAFKDMIKEKIWLVTLALISPLLIKGLVLLSFPKNLPVSEEEHRKVGDTGFFQTLSRILNNGPATTHAISAGILSAGAWGFAFYNEDFVRAKYLLVFADSNAANQADGLRLIAVIMMIVIVGYQLAAPTPGEFDRLTAVKKTLKMAVLALIAVVVMMVLGCSSQSLEGMTENGLVYQQPSFSFGCGCAKGYNKLFPVCSLANKSTYFSPCHAGCERRVDFHGTNMLSSCRSSPSGEAFEGVCNGNSCFGLYSLHQILYVGFTIAVVLSILMHFMMVLRSVDERDKSTAIGLVFSAVALSACVGGHLLYVGISSWTCAFSENGFCHLQNWRFQYAVSGATIGFIIVSAALNLGSLFVTKRQLQATL